MANSIQTPYTAIISDLHLCEEQIPEPRRPLWKRYKSRDFFFDAEFEVFLNQIQEKAGGQPVELVLNGDIFDFDSIMSLPDSPTFRISWAERIRGLNAEEDKSAFKMSKIIEDHPLWFSSLREFLLRGNQAIFIFGNHDVELHFPLVQQEILKALNLPEEKKSHVRFNEWFYISNQDTLIEHSNQYDPYCVCQDPLHPFVLKYNRVAVRLAFGNLAGRYLINGMGYFNPHSDSNFIMSATEYFRFFRKYLLTTQPLIMWTWFWGSIVTLYQSFVDRLLPEIRDPLTLEDRIEDIARKANATPRIVRELRELTAYPATSSPITIARELWLDRAFLVLIALVSILQLFVYVKLVYSISLFWIFLPLFIFVPFFIFYAKSVRPSTAAYKEPKEHILQLTSQIARVKRVVYGHTHIVRHEMIEDVEHLNCGTWSPAFSDVECTKPIGRKTYVWIEPGPEGRQAQLLEFDGGKTREFTGLEPQLSDAEGAD